MDLLQLVFVVMILLNSKEGIFLTKVRALKLIMLLNWLDMELKMELNIGKLEILEELIGEIEETLNLLEVRIVLELKLTLHIGQFLSLNQKKLLENNLQLSP